MKIVVTGTRGIPRILGGVETVCEELYPRLAAKGHDITLIRRSCYVDPDNPPIPYKGVKLLDIPTPRRKSLEAIVHTFRAILQARRLHPDVLHIHAIGPSLLVPFAKMLGMKVVMTHHGPDYDRGKWGKLAKGVLKAGEWAGVRFSDRVIVISSVIADICARKHGRRDTDLIFNGVAIPAPSDAHDYLDSLGLEPGKFVVGMGRFVPEKGFHDLLEAFPKAQVPEGTKLVLVGDADHQDHYALQLKENARSNGAVLTGFIKGEKMRQVMANAALYVMPSYHEGLPIALLEAMAYGLDVAVSDIPSTRLPELEKEDFFPVGNTDALAMLISSKLKNPATRKYDLSRYDWDTIATQTEEVYRKAVAK